MPPKQQLLSYIDKIYEHQVLTNNGPLVRELEQRLTSHLNVPHLSLVSNGHTALMLMLKAFDITGKVITTPFTFVSSLNSLLWNNCTPVFADIHPQTLSIDPVKVAEILEREKDIQAILPTHLFGSACDIEALQVLADRYGVKLFFDAAQSFGVKYKGQSVFKYGHASALSLQAYKLLHTIEGGAVITEDKEAAEKVFNLRYFGINLNEEIVLSGINGKNSELHAAFGLMGLDNFSEIKNARAKVYQVYREAFKQHPFQWMSLPPGVEINYSYFPVLLRSKLEREQFQKSLLRMGIQTKNYFSPSLNTVSHLVSYEPMDVSESVCNRIVCLPVHQGLSESDVEHVVRSVKNFFEGSA